MLHIVLSSNRNISNSKQLSMASQLRWGAWDMGKPTLTYSGGARNSSHTYPCWTSVVW